MKNRCTLVWGARGLSCWRFTCEGRTEKYYIVAVWAASVRAPGAAGRRCCCVPRGASLGGAVVPVFVPCRAAAFPAYIYIYIYIYNTFRNHFGSSARVIMVGPPAP